MGIPVTDETVAKYVDCLRTGISTKDIFPARMSACAFTEIQRQAIRAARAASKAAHKQLMPKTGSSPVQVTAPGQLVRSAAPMTKLRRILFLQHGKCFFCGQPLPEAEASIEHLHPKSRGGGSDDDNEVVCHKSLNQAFGDMGLKRKFEFILRSSGSLKCPGT
jgi:hypothetical protein